MVKRSNCTSFHWRWSLLVLLLIALAAVHALPPPPPASPNLATIPSNILYAANTGINFVYPLVNATPALNITYSHNASGPQNCTIKVDSTVLRTHRNLNPDLLMSDASFTPFPLGSHTFRINCTNGTWSAEVSREVLIDNETRLEGLTLRDKKVFPGASVRITGRSDPLTVIVFNVTGPAGKTFNTTSDLSGDFTVYYNASSIGVYRIIAYPVSNSEARLGGLLTVIARNPVLLLMGPRNVTTGSAFTIKGIEFIQKDNVSLSLAGNGVSMRNLTTAYDDGEFTFSYPGTLPAGWYAITAYSTGDATVKASLNVSVIAPATTAPQTPAPTTQTPPTPATLPPEEEYPDETAVQTPVQTQPEVEAPAPIYADPDPAYQDLEIPEKSSMMWWLAPLLFFVIIGGLGGYLVYNGTLDVSSMDAFKTSLANMFAGNGAPHNARDDVFQRLQGSARYSSIDPAEAQTIKTFIHGERAKGYDDLTIRSALLGKGWDKAEVDRVFDEVYREHQ